MGYCSAMSAIFQEEHDLRESLMMAQVGRLTGPQSKGNADDLVTSSRPPSPPESGTTTPRVTIAPCPSRLLPLYPPINYSCVDEDKIYRSSYPLDRNVEFIDRLGVRSILTLVDTEATVGFRTWLDTVKPRHARMEIGKNKDPEGRIDAEFKPIYEALLFILNSSNQPVFVHCNQGKHRTGCVIGCLRRVQGMPMDEIIHEYKTHAEEKSRSGDIALIESFNPDSLFQYAKSEGIVDSLSSSDEGQNRLVRRDSTFPIKDIHSLCAALQAGLLGYTDWSSDESSASSDGTMSPLLFNGASPSHGRIVEQPRIIGFNINTSAVIREGDKVEEDAMTDGVAEEG